MVGLSSEYSCSFGNIDNGIIRDSYENGFSFRTARRKKEYAHSVVPFLWNLEKAIVVDNTNINRPQSAPGLKENDDKVLNNKNHGAEEETATQKEVKIDEKIQYSESDSKVAGKLDNDKSKDNINKEKIRKKSIKPISKRPVSVPPMVNPPFVSYGHKTKGADIAIKNTHNIRASAQVYPAAKDALRRQTITKEAKYRVKINRTLEEINKKMYLDSLQRETACWTSTYQNTFIPHTPRDYSRSLFSRCNSRAYWDSLYSL